jgi:hypothetical protein
MKGMLEESPLCAHPGRSVELGSFPGADIRPAKADGEFNWKIAVPLSAQSSRQ